MWLNVSSGQEVERAAVPDLKSVWMSTLVSLEDPRWPIESILCDGCTLAAFKYLQRLLQDPEQAGRTLKELQDDAHEFNKELIQSLLTENALNFQATYDGMDDPVLECKPMNVFYHAQGFLPTRIEQSDDNIIFRYELFNEVRTVYMDGRGHPSNIQPTALGHSIGWWDGPSLVVETAGIESSVLTHLAPIVAGIRTSDQARGIERYTRSEDGQRLDLELTIVDPRTFRKPLIEKKAFLSYPNAELLEFNCEVPSNPGRLR